MILVPGRPVLSLGLHALLFSLWHIGPLFLGGPLWVVLAVLLVPFLSGLGWGWQVRHDRTVVWAMTQRSLIWIIGKQFAFGWRPRGAVAGGSPWRSVHSALGLSRRRG